MTNLIIEPWSESLSISEQNARNEFKQNVESGEWEERKLELFPNDEELQFIYKDNWEKEKINLLRELRDEI